MTDAAESDNDPFGHQTRVKDVGRRKEGMLSPSSIQ